MGSQSPTLFPQGASPITWWDVIPSHVGHAKAGTSSTPSRCGWQPRDLPLHLGKSLPETPHSMGMVSQVFWTRRR